MSKQRPCRNCGCTTDQALFANVAANGHRQVGWRCLTCERWQPDKSGNLWIPYDLLRAHRVEVEALPVAAETKPEPCCVTGCTRMDTELHHFAPRHLYGKEECERHPTAYYCKFHHEEWHRRVTPQMHHRAGSGGSGGSGSRNGSGRTAAPMAPQKESA